MGKLTPHPRCLALYTLAALEAPLYTCALAHTHDHCFYYLEVMNHSQEGAHICLCSVCADCSPRPSAHNSQYLCLLRPCIIALLYCHFLWEVLPTLPNWASRLGQVKSSKYCAPVLHIRAAAAVLPV